MGVTIQQIAEAAGVSRGTVDRVLNNRGRVKPEVEERVRRLIKEMDYKPNRAGRALAMSHKTIKIGVVLQLADTEFMRNVYQGCKAAAAEYGRMGMSVDIRTLSEMDADRTAQIIEELVQQDCKGIALVPADGDRLYDEVRKITESGIPVVTLNGDIKDSGRMCYVGQDSEQSGRAAAGLMAEIMPEGAWVQVVSGYTGNYANRHRIRGFTAEFRRLRPDCRMLDIRYAFDDNEISEKIMVDVLSKYRQLSGIYIASAGVEGVCRALRNYGEASTIKVIGHDIGKENIALLKRGDINFLIGQNPYEQGFRPVKLLFEKLYDEKNPEKEYQYMDIEIRTKYNL